MRKSNDRTALSQRIPAICAITVAALMAAFSSPALASCDDRPGTPTNVRTMAGPFSITLSWHDTTKRGEGSCHDIDIKGPGNSDLGINVTGGVCLGGGTDGQYVVNNLNLGEQYCFRIKARDHANAQGCASQNWSNPVCDTPLPLTGPGVGKIADYMPDMDLFGSDLAAATPILVPANQPFDLKSTAERCRAECNGERRCVAWTLVKPGFQGPSALCYLKTTAPAPSSNNCCASGTKLMANTDLPGDDMINMPSPNEADCERKCVDNNRCTTWTFLKGARPTCFLKNSLPNAKASACCTSGRIR